MFQTFDNTADPTKGAERVASLRKELDERGLVGFLVPRTDEYQNEYVPPSAERLAWLTGFSGSAGLAIIMTEQAALFVDGRYTIQARDQVDGDLFEILQIPEAKPFEWLAKHIKNGDRFGYDPKLHTVEGVKRMQKAVDTSGAVLEAIDENPVDAIWSDRPRPPVAKVQRHPIEFAGVEASEKIAELQKATKDADADAVLLTSPESVCWALNIRGSDVAHTPLALCTAIIHANGKPELFVTSDKLDEEVRDYLTGIAEIHDPGDMAERLAKLGADKARVQLDPGRSSHWYANQLEDVGAEVRHGTDPCVLPRARKNAAEIDGARSAHKRDGGAVCRFLCWLDENAGDGSVDEIAAARKLEGFRADTQKLHDISFDTISGSGSNGAIVHYRVTEATNRSLEPGSLYLVDSGAQYLDGTTDTTRTIAIGEPTAQMRRHFTLVLKGHIAVATARFPKGTRGQDLDPFARRALWAAGLDYDHGTGHGVGSFLSVHEGPQRISKLGPAPLEPGMICSNEPGFYSEGEYGIRIENLELVTAAELIEGGDREMQGFETLTLAPIDLRLVDPDLLTADEMVWLDNYHARVRAEIGPLLDADTTAWLEHATRSVADQ